MPSKTTDTRRDAFVARYGDVAVELDALPVDVLRERIRSEVTARIDMEALAATLEQERSDLERLSTMLAGGESA